MAHLQHARTALPTMVRPRRLDDLAPPTIPIALLQHRRRHGRSSRRIPVIRRIIPVSLLRRMYCVMVLPINALPIPVRGVPVPVRGMSTPVGRSTIPVGRNTIPVRRSADKVVSPCIRRRIDRRLLSERIDRRKRVRCTTHLVRSCIRMHRRSRW